MARVYPIDRGVIDRTQQWLLKQRAADGTWSTVGGTHGETIDRMGSPKLLLTSYVVWSLAESGLRTQELEKSVAYIRDHVGEAGDNAYVLALAANALAAWDPKDDSTFEVLKRLARLRQDRPEWRASCYPAAGQSLTFARGDSVTVETTALAVLAMLKAKADPARVNEALTYLIKSKYPGGTWGSTSATILSLKALVAGLGTAPKGKGTFTILVNGQEAAKGEVTEFNAEVVQTFDLAAHTRIGRNEVAIKTAGDVQMMYQLVGRHYEPWQRAEAPRKPVIDIDVAYDRTELSAADKLRATATLRYHGDVPTYMVIVDLGIPPGFAPEPEEFEQMVKRRQIEKYTATARQVTLYLGNVRPGDELKFPYTLRAKFPLKAKTPATTAYEYYTPANRAESQPVELSVHD
jgi:hypothetical protein